MGGSKLIGARHAELTHHRMTHQTFNLLSFLMEHVTYYHKAKSLAHHISLIEEITRKVTRYFQ